MATETHGDKRKTNQPGVYKHPETGRILETSKGKTGYIQADGLVQVGFVYQGPPGSRNEKPKTALETEKPVQEPSQKPKIDDAPKTDDESIQEPSQESPKGMDKSKPKTNKETE